MVIQPFFCGEVLSRCFFLLFFRRAVIDLSSCCHRAVIVSGVERLVRQCDQLCKNQDVYY